MSTSRYNVARVLTIAGSDPSGGAGIQADIKTITSMGGYAMSAITALTVQNTLGISDVHIIPANIVAKQIDAVITDIGVDAVKTGMLANGEIVRTVATQLITHKVKKIIVDPIIKATDGVSLLATDSLNALRDCLLPLAYVITPNIPEAEIITGIKIINTETIHAAAKAIHNLGAKNVVIKGGHSSGENAVDVLYDGHDFYELVSVRIDTKDTHGTGCTFSAALATTLAQGKDLRQALKDAKEFTHIAITNSFRVGAGCGPTNHLAPLIAAHRKDKKIKHEKQDDIIRIGSQW